MAKKRTAAEAGFMPMEQVTPDFFGGSQFGVGGQAPPWAMGGQRGMGMNPYQLGMGIGQIASGYDPTGQGGFEDEQRQRGPQGGAFSQIGDAAMSVGRAIGGLPGKAVGAVGDLVDWSSMEPMEKAWLLSQAVGTGADIYGAYKQGKLEDEERKKRQRSAEALRPYMQMLMSKAG